MQFIVTNNAGEAAKLLAAYIAVNPELANGAAYNCRYVNCSK